MCLCRAIVRQAAALAAALVAAVALPACARAADWGLVLFVIAEPPVSAAPEPASYAPGARAVARLILENRGAAALDGIRVEVTLSGAVPAVERSGSWKRDGARLRATIDTLAPGESIELPLVVELADGTERGARGTGGEARIRARVPASGETLVAEAIWPIASCADAYHAALRQVRYGAFARLRAALAAARTADGTLPGRAAFTYRPDSRETAAAARFSEQIAAARGLDSYYAGEDIRWLSERLVSDIGAYLGQERYAGLCTGVAEWTGALGDHIGRFARHADEIRAHRASLEPPVRALVAAAGGSGPEGQDADIEAWGTAAALLPAAAADAPPPGAAIFTAAGSALEAAGEGLGAGRRQALVDAFAALERLWYLELAEARAAAVADGFADTLQAIRDAHRTTCTCGA